MHETSDFRDVKRLHQERRARGLEKLSLGAVEHVASHKDDPAAECVVAIDPSPKPYAPTAIGALDGESALSVPSLFTRNCAMVCDDRSTT